MKPLCDLGPVMTSLGLAFGFCPITFRLLTPWVGTESSGLTTDSSIELLSSFLPLCYSNLLCLLPTPQQIQQFIPTALS